MTELTELSKAARETGVYVRVVKNTLAKRALAGTELECMQDGLVGPLLLAFSMEDPGSAARLISTFAKTHDKLITNPQRRGIPRDKYCHYIVALDVSAVIEEFDHRDQD